MKNLTAMRRKSALVLSVLLALSLTACGSETAEALRFGTGNVAGTYYACGAAITELAQTEMENTAFNVKSTAGSAANIRLLSEGFLQLAFAQNDTLHDAYTGTGTFAHPGASAAIGAEHTYSAVAALYTESCQVVVPADSDIESVADLRGKTVSVGEEESGVLQNADQILLAYGLTRQMLTAKYLSFSASAEAMLEGEIDAMFFTAGAPTSAIENLAGEMDVRILSLDDDAIMNLSESYGFYSPCAIPAGTYAGQTEPVKTVGVKSVLVAADDVPAETVEALTAAIFTHGADLQYSTPGNTRPDLEFATEGVSIPFHQGALNYYAQQGLTPATAENGGGNA